MIDKRTCPHHAECSAVFDQKQHYSHDPPPYSPNFAQSDFFVFPQLKEVLKGQHFADVEEVRQKTTEATRHQNQCLN